MAVTYNFSVKRLGKSDSFSISATVTDDTKPAGHQTETVSAIGLLDTPERREAVWNGLQTQYLSKVVESASMSALESEGKSYLEAL